MENRGFNKFKKKLRQIAPKNKLHCFSEKVRCTLKKTNQRNRVFRTSSSLTCSYLTYLVEKLAIVPVSLWVYIAMQFNVVLGNSVLHMCNESEVI